MEEKKNNVSNTDKVNDLQTVATSNISPNESRPVQPEPDTDEDAATAEEMEAFIRDRREREKKERKERNNDEEVDICAGRAPAGLPLHMVVRHLL